VGDILFEKCPDCLGQNDILDIEGKNLEERGSAYWPGLFFLELAGRWDFAE
jgi:hypothetical protein